MEILSKMMKTDSVDVISPEGYRQKEVRCQFKPPKVIVPDESLDIGEGFTIERKLPNGRTESYMVEQVQLYANNPGGMPTFYELQVRRNVPRAHAKSIAYNISGPNARINIGSSDSSINISHVEAQTLFQRMKSISSEIPDSKIREAVHLSIENMESSIDSQGFGNAYQRFIAVVADHLTLFGPFLPALAQILAR